MERRKFLGLCAGTAAIGTMGYAMGLFSKVEAAAKGDFPHQLTEAQWREKLTDAEFRVLRKEGTEPSRSSPLDAEKRDGVFVCKGCANELYSSADKFDSGTGWPSFTQPIRPEAIGTSKDFKLILPRTEVHCANCGGHLGHVFDDGPEPTGLRYCMNGIAMNFIPAAQ